MITIMITIIAITLVIVLMITVITIINQESAKVKRGCLPLQPGH